MSIADQQHLFRCFARVADGLASPHRLALLQLLGQAERDVETLAAISGLPVASTSQHLQRLKRAGLVSSRQVGRRRLYRLVSPRVSALTGALERLADECLAEVGPLAGTDDTPLVGPAELARLMRLGSVLVLDVRPVEEYASAHIAGALNIPLAELPARLDELPGEREIVVYCRGPYCQLTGEALSLLRRHRFSTRKIDRSINELTLAGFPVERA